MADANPWRPGHTARRVAAGLAVFTAVTLSVPSRPPAGTASAVGDDGASPAAAGVSFRGVAAAEGVRVGVAAAGAPVTNNVVDGASPIAQAAVDSTSGSSALASVAYPGDVVVTTPGLLAGVSGGQLSGVPPYPLLASAGSTTTPEQRVEGPGSTMHATATGRRAHAAARGGAAPPADGAPAPAWGTSSTVEADDAGAVLSTAVSEVTGVTIGPVTFGRVTARSAVHRQPGADPVRETGFEATGLTVEGTAVALTPAGLVVGGTTTPLSASALQAVLDAAGVSVRPLAAETTADGVVSAGLVVTRTQELPTAISPVTVTYTFGRAMAAVSATALPPVASVEAVAPRPAPTSPGGTVVGPDGAGPVDGPETGAAAADIRLPATVPGVNPPSKGGPAGGVSAVTEAVPVSDAGSNDAAGTSPGDTAVGQGTATGGPIPVRKVGSRLFDLTTIYLLLVAAAATAGAAIQFVRHAGVLRWTSRPG